MAAAKLVTRCPACRTAFRLVADQLRLRQGLVRCGQCDTVFDAREHLIEVPAPAAASPEGSTAPARATDSPAVSTPAAVTLAAALAHAEQTQAASRAREHDAPFAPGFDPGYEVPALDSPTTMMSEPATEEAGEATAPPAVAADSSAPPEEDQHATQDALANDAPETVPHPIAEPVAEVMPEVMPEADREDAAEAEAPATGAAPEVETPLTAPPTPWPALNHTVFDDAPPHPPSLPPAASAPSHSSLDPAAAFAPGNPSGMPPYGAYSAKASWPPLRATEIPPPPSASPTLAEPIATAADQALADSTGSTESTGGTDGNGSADIATGHAPRHGLPEVADDRLESADEPPEAAEAAEAPAFAPAVAPPEPFPADEPVPSASGFLRSEDPADPEAEAWAAQAKAVIANDLHVTPRDGTPDAVARETATRHWLRQDAGAPATGGPAFAPDFLRHTREREAPRAPRSVTLPGNRRSWARAAVVMLGIGVLLQGAYLARSQIAGSLPVLRPVLEAACAPFGCTVPPWRDLEALRIDSSQLQKQDEASDVYQLAVTLRNQGRATTALPAIELVMTDLQDQLLLRRVLQPAEYLEPVQRGFATTGLRAGSELPVRVRFRTQQVAANYRVLIFYP